jgi:hypothetical protein
MLIPTVAVRVAALAAYAACNGTRVQCGAGSDADGQTGRANVASMAGDRTSVSTGQNSELNRRRAT